MGPNTRTCTQLSSGDADWSGGVPLCRRTYVLNVHSENNDDDVSHKFSGKEIRV